MFHGVAFLVLLFSLSFPANGWSEVSPGIEYTTIPYRNRLLHIVRANLRHPSVQFRVTGPEGRAHTPRSLAKQTGAVVVMNGDFYDLEYDFIPLGLSVSEGKRWPGTPVKVQWEVLACNSTIHCGVQVFVKGNAIPKDWQNVIGGRDRIVREGKPWSVGDDASCGILCEIRAPRTAVGIDKTGTVIFFAVAEGITNDHGGLTIHELAEHLIPLGIYDAIHLDGGGSAQLVIQHQLVTARPITEQFEREVGNMLALFQRY